MLGKKAFDQNSTLTKWYADTFCTFLPAQYICNGLSSIVMGWDRTNLNWASLFFYVVDVLSLLNSFEDEINITSLFSYNNGK